MKTLAAVSLAGLLLSWSCGGTATSPSASPQWLVALIESFRSAPAGNPPRSIYRYTYNGQTVYFVPAQCCDQMSTLYDAEGRVMCAPDGGISGSGDGRCADFFRLRSNETLVWRDSR